MIAFAASYKRPVLTQQAKDGKEIKQTLWFFCTSLLPFIDLIKKKEKYYKHIIESLLEDNIPFALNAKESQTLR